MHMVTTLHYVCMHHITWMKKQKVLIPGTTISHCNNIHHRHAMIVKSGARMFPKALQVSKTAAPTPQAHSRQRARGRDTAT